MGTIPQPQIIRSNRGNISLQVKATGEVIVKAPRFMPIFFINQFLANQQDWINDKLKKVQNLPRVKKRQYQDGEEFFYLGRKVRLTIGNFTKIEVKNDLLLFPQALFFRIEKELINWYKQLARQVITEQVTKYAKEMGVIHNGLTFTDTRSQWGRCSHDNRLQFSWRLVMSPPLTLNYVVVHELTHITEKNHSRAFWARVRNYNPSYRQQIKWLKENGHSLF